MKSVFGKYVIGIAALACLVAMMPGLAQQKSEMDPKEKEAFDIGAQAYIYGYPLVLMDQTRRVMTNVASPQDNGRAPINQFAHVKKFPTPEMKDVVKPNVDTLYSIAWLDLSDGPMVLHLPDTNGRYYVMQILSGWTNVFAALGSRTTGTCEGNFVITGPNWSGEIPEGVRELKSPTNMVWIVGRTKTDGPSDYKAVNAIQKQYTLTPLRSWGESYTPPTGMRVNSKIDMKTPPEEQVAEMDAETFFSRLAMLLKDNPPADEDSRMVAKLARIGIVPGESFEFGKLDGNTRRGLERSIRYAREKLDPRGMDTGMEVNGWKIGLEYGDYGTDYNTRAIVAKAGLGANLAKDAVYPFTSVDSEGRRLNGSNQYVMHFERGQLPPVNAFWSLTMYNKSDFLVDNPIDRYALSSWMQFTCNEDGSLDLYIQRDSPGKDLESNWLPAPEGDFILTMRLYWPKQEVLDGTWTPPPVKQVKQETKEPEC